MKNITKQKKNVFNIIQIGDKSNIVSRTFDFFLVVVILLNISAMLLNTFDELSSFFHLFKIIEVVTTIIFLIEYCLRIWTADLLYPNVSKPKAILKFLTSYDGVVDLLTIIPLVVLTGFIVFRMLRVVRIFHLFRINAKYDSFHVITTVIYEKKMQLLSSIFILLVLMVSSSLCMYSVEHEAQPNVFSNAFSGIWWSMSTILTVGYGDIYPITLVGKVMAIIIAFLGVGVVAIPTGIISAGFVEQYTKIKKENTKHEKKLVYISHPIGNKNKDTKDVERIVSKLYECKEIGERYCFVSPIHNFGFVSNQLESTKKQNYGIDLLDHCDLMLVFGSCENDSFSKSTQCKVEIEYCTNNNKPYYSCPTIDDAIYFLKNQK